MAGNAELTPSTGLAVLGLLLERPSWGYELVARFERIFGGEEPWAWQVTSTAIYQALKRLERDGMIEPMDGEKREPSLDSKQRRMRQPYRVTAEGARSMREWLAQPMASNPTTQEVLLRVHFGEVKDETLRAMLKRHMQVCLDELERIAAVPAETRMERLLKEDWRLSVQARLTWIDFALAEVRGPDDARVRRVEP